MEKPAVQVEPKLASPKWDPYTEKIGLFECQLASATSISIGQEGEIQANHAIDAFLVQHAENAKWHV
eukprot:8637703-Ditylum_brightwellii.AAC.1